MGQLDELIREDEQAPTIYEGEVSRDVVSEADGMYVVRDEFNREDGPCPWPAREGLLPSEGDRVLVYAPPDGDAWVIGWWPYA